MGIVIFRRMVSTSTLIRMSAASSAGIRLMDIAIFLRMRGIGMGTELANAFGAAKSLVADIAIFRPMTSMSFEI